MIDGNTPTPLVEGHMRALGFTDHVPTTWYKSFPLGHDVFFSVHIDKKTGDYEHHVTDESFGQHYYYNSIDTEFARAVRTKVANCVLWLQDYGFDITVDHNVYSYERA